MVIGYDIRLSSFALSRAVIQGLTDTGSDVIDIVQLTSQDTRPAYIEHLITYIKADSLKPLKIICNAENRGAGDVINAIEPFLPFTWEKVHHNPDGNFPNGVPNPLLVENRPPSIQAIKETKADIGIAWDGDFDRCFFFDENGDFIEGYYIVGLLPKHF